MWLQIYRSISLDISRGSEQKLMLPHGHASRAVTDATSAARNELAHSLYTSHCREPLQSPARSPQLYPLVIQD